MIRALAAQFEHPRGFLGRLAGKWMDYEHQDTARWAVQQLRLQWRDYLLEIGPGAGLGIEAAARKAAFVAGVDVSDVMLEEAQQRNADKIAQGKVGLLCADVLRLPYVDMRFDKALTLNSFHLWPDTLAGLAEVRRVLKPGGLLALVEQPPDGIDSKTRMKERASPLLYNLEPGGFSHVDSIYARFRRGWAVCVLASC